ncbi:hypothetical protein K4F52_004427 [Lecanicillium sp. MT-2017a]|nr:hypothetical protein K4F52_004427 [Lecanicillium sp. MT-2017a]
MATPQSTTSDDASAANRKLEQITFRFCSECSNMLYPKEDSEAHKLQFTCRTCQYTEEARSSCVFRNILNNSSGETAGVTQDVGSDPTVSDCLSGVCTGCGEVICCYTCGLPSCDMDLVDQPDRHHDYYNPDTGYSFFATNVGWSDEDLFDNDNAATEWDDAFFGEPTDVTTSSTSDAPTWSDISSDM